MDYYKAICPSTKESCIDTYRCEPYVYAQMISGQEAPVSGEGKNAWLTGTAAWTFLSISQGILGIVPDYDGLCINPCIPAGWDGFEVVRVFRGATIRIKVENPGHVCSGIAAMRVDGKAVAGNKIPVPASGTVCEVRIIMG